MSSGRSQIDTIMTEDRKIIIEHNSMHRNQDNLEEENGKS
jgi:hypothetical protein